MRTPPEIRFERFVDRTATCWLWKGGLDRYGYGQFWNGRVVDGDYRCDRAHRVAYELFVGPIPEGLLLDHLCETRSCVNPAHLEPVTNADNLRRKWDRQRGGRCQKGHPRTPENTYSKADGSGRRCRPCHAEYQNARYHATREASDADAA